MTYCVHDPSRFRSVHSLLNIVIVFQPDTLLPGQVRLFFEILESAEALKRNRSHG